YTQSDLDLITGVASYVTTGMQNAQLFNEIQRQGEKERVINMSSQKSQGTLDVESALQTAVTELGNVLQANYTQVTLAAATEETAVPPPTNGVNQPEKTKQNGTHS
ncbi:MAG: hypothetical protein DWQ04_17435, partial [Chloroflexi bacterium]